MQILIFTGIQKGILILKQQFIKHINEKYKGNKH